MIQSFLFFIIDLMFSHEMHYSLNIVLYFTLYRSMRYNALHYTLTPFIFLNLEDFLYTDTFGSTFVYMIPALYFLHTLLDIFSHHPHALFTISCIVAFIGKCLTLYYGFGIIAYTGPQIAANLVIIVLFLIYTLQGRSGNRFYPE